MRILFNCTGDYGHFHPLAALASTLADRGNQVLFATEKCFADVIIGEGYEVTQLPDRNPSMGSPEWGSMVQKIEQEDVTARVPMVLEWFWNAGILALPALQEAIREWRPSIIVREQTAWGSALAAEIAGIPFATFLFSPFPFEFLDALIGERIGRDMNALGIQDKKSILDDRYLGLCGGPPRWFEDGELGKNTRLIYPPLPNTNDGDMPSWLSSMGESRPLVYVTMGTVFNSEPNLFLAILESLESAAVDALITVGPKRSGAVTIERLGSLREGIRVEEYVPQSYVLPRASLVIAHGGYGTTMGALSHGVPLVCIPQAALDNQLNSQRVVAIGAGVIVEEASTSEVSDAIQLVLEDSAFRIAAEGAALSMKSLPDARQTAIMIENMASKNI